MRFVQPSLFLFSIFGFNKACVALLESITTVARENHKKKRNEFELVADCLFTKILRDI